MEDSNNQMIQELHDKHKQLLDTIDHQTKMEESNNQTIQELREKHKQFQANINGQTKTVEAMKQNAHLVCGKLKDVSTRKVEAVTTSKWAEIPPAINIANVRPNNVGL
jgi:SMC interacting uncharacterized protein involved in chromosome segregation